jgi:hypothetical protein
MYFRYVSPDPTYDDVKNKPIRLPGLKPGDMRRVHTERRLAPANVSPQRTETMPEAPLRPTEEHGPGTDILDATRAVTGGMHSPRSGRAAGSGVFAATSRIVAEYPELQFWEISGSSLGYQASEDS